MKWIAICLKIKSLKVLQRLYDAARVTHLNQRVCAALIPLFAIDFLKDRKFWYKKFWKFTAAHQHFPK